MKLPLSDSKKVMVVMDADLHRILKALAGAYDMTISELVALSTEVQVSRFGLRCLLAAEVFALHEYPINHKVHKWCWGAACMNCIHQAQCNKAEYAGTFVSRTRSNCVDVPGDKAPGVPAYVDDRYVERPFPKQEG